MLYTINHKNSALALLVPYFFRSSFCNTLPGIIPYRCARFNVDCPLRASAQGSRRARDSQGENSRKWWSTTIRIFCKRSSLRPSLNPFTHTRFDPFPFHFPAGLHSSFLVSCSSSAQPHAGPLVCESVWG